VVQATLSYETFLVEETFMVIWLATVFMIVGSVLEMIGHVLWRLGQRG
jgi:hypothetical protein